MKAHLRLILIKNSVFAFLFHQAFGSLLPVNYISVGVNWRKDELAGRVQRQSDGEEEDRDRVIVKKRTETE